MPVRSRSRCSSSESLERASVRSATHSASSASASRPNHAAVAELRGRLVDERCVAGRRACRRNHRCAQATAQTPATPACRSGRSISSVRRSEPRSRGVARRKRTFCAIRSRSKAPLRIFADRRAAGMFFKQRRQPRPDARAMRSRSTSGRENPARRACATPSRSRTVERREQRRTRVLTLRSG